MTKSRAVFMPVLVLAGVFAAEQTRATDIQQAAIEIAAAKHLASLKPVPAGGYVLDARSYVLSVDIGLRGKRILSEPSSEMLKSHTARHLEVIKAELTLAGVTSEDDKCPTNEPGLCRLGAYPGLVALGAAIVDGDSAQISVSIWTKDDGIRSITGVRRTTIHITLAMVDQLWRVARTITSIS